MKKVKRMLRVGRILRYRAYKQAGIVRHRKHLDRMFRVAFLFVVALYAGTLLAILKWTWPQIAPSTQPAEAVQEEAEQRTFAVQPVSGQVQLYNKLNYWNKRPIYPKLI